METIASFWHRVYKILRFYCLVPCVCVFMQFDDSVVRAHGRMLSLVLLNEFPYPPWNLCLSVLNLLSHFKKGTRSKYVLSVKYSLNNTQIWYFKFSTKQKQFHFNIHMLASYAACCRLLLVLLCCLLPLLLCIRHRRRRLCICMNETIIVSTHIVWMVTKINHVYMKLLFCTHYDLSILFRLLHTHTHTARKWK